MTKEKVDQIIKSLEHVRASPSMYFGNSYSFTDVVNYLHGYHMALMAICETVPRPVNEVDGWDTSYYRVNYPSEAQATSLSGDYITDRVLSVELEAWKAFRSELAD